MGCAYRMLGACRGAVRSGRILRSRPGGGRLRSWRSACGGRRRRRAGRRHRGGLGRRCGRRRSRATCARGVSPGRRLEHGRRERTAQRRALRLARGDSQVHRVALRVRGRQRGRARQADHGGRHRPDGRHVLPRAARREPRLLHVRHGLEPLPRHRSQRRRLRRRFRPAHPERQDHRNLCQRDGEDTPAGEFPGVQRLGLHGAAPRPGFVRELPGRRHRRPHARQRRGDEGRLQGGGGVRRRAALPGRSRGQRPHGGHRRGHEADLRGRPQLLPLALRPLFPRRLRQPHRVLRGRPRLRGPGARGAGGRDGGAVPAVLRA